MLKTYKKLLPYAVGVGALLLVSYFCLYVGSHIESFGILENSEYCNECDEYQETWYWYEDPNDTGSPNDWESGGAGPGKP